MLAMVSKTRNLGRVTCSPVSRELKVVSISSLIWISLKADQAELVFGKYDAAFAITTIVSVSLAGQVGRERW